MKHFNETDVVIKTELTVEVVMLKWKIYLNIFFEVGTNCPYAFLNKALLP